VAAITDAANAHGLRRMYYTAYLAETGFYDVGGVVYNVSRDMGDPDMARLEEWLPQLVKQAVRDAYIVHDVGDDDDNPRAIAAMINATERVADEESSKCAKNAVLLAREWLRDIKDEAREWLPPARRA
jgi:hypothetical protein